MSALGVSLPKVQQLGRHHCSCLPMGTRAINNCRKPQRLTWKGIKIHWQEEESSAGLARSPKLTSGRASAKGCTQRGARFSSGPGMDSLNQPEQPAVDLRVQPVYEIGERQGPGRDPGPKVAG